LNNDIKNFFLAGIGSAAYTYEKATTLIEDLMQKGKLTLEEGKDLSEELKRTVKVKKDVSNSLAKDKTPLTKEDIASLLKEMNFATKNDIEILNTRLKALETNNS
jgi:polyhydroxyalkanoate synthesis regulator phasin